MDRLSPRALPTVDPGEPAEVVVDLLFRQHYARLLRIACALLGSREGAEDAVQEAFVSLYRHYDQLRAPEDADRYLRSAVLNRCRSGIRANIRERARVAAAIRPLTAVGSDEVVGARQDAEAVGAALRRLPRRQREVVACRYLLELSVAETAESLGISDGAVKRHAHRALQSLHDVLEVTR